MASKKSKLKKRKEAQKRRIPKKEKIKLNSDYVTINKNGEMVYKNDYFYQKDKHTGIRYIDLDENIINMLSKKEKQKVQEIKQIKNVIDERMNEYNTERYKKGSEDYNDLLKIMNNENKEIKQEKIRQLNFEKIKQNEFKRDKKNHSNDNDVIITTRLNHSQDVHNTTSIDNNIREIADLIDKEFIFVRDLMFPSYEENSSYENMMNLKDNQEKDFSSYINDLFLNGDITNDTYNKILSLMNECYRL